MYFDCRNFYVELIVILLTDLSFGQKMQLTAKQRSRLRPIFEDAEHKNVPKEFFCFDVKQNYEDCQKHAAFIVFFRQANDLSVLNLTIFDKNTKELYTIIHGRPENKDLEKLGDCENHEIIMPDFHAPGRRISDVKCLENLWKIRFYDEALIKMVMCKKPYDIIQLNEHFGDYDQPGEFPHMGAIGWETSDGSWLFMCEGALISEKFMVTAAHCSRLSIPDVRVVDPLPKVVRFGEPNISDKETIGKAPKDVFIQRFIIHPNHRFLEKYYDIAIVELQKEMTFSIKVHPSCIWTNIFAVAGEAELTGWNIIKSNKTVLKKEESDIMFDYFTRQKLIEMAKQETYGNDSLNNPVMQLAKVNILNTEECEKLTRKKIDKSWKGFLFHQMCVERSLNVKNTFQVDIGGVLEAPINIPEQIDWKIHYIIGVKSFTFGCKSSKTLGIYTKLSTFLDWIEDVVWGAESKEVK